MTLEPIQLYRDLKKAYDHILDRRRFLSDRAATLIGFDGLGATILAGFVLGSRTTSSSPILATLIAVALLSYLGSAVSGITAILERPWYVAPSVPQPALHNIEKFFAGTSTMSLKAVTLQVAKAVELNEAENLRKYRWLNVGYVLLLIAVIVSVGAALLNVFALVKYDP